MDIDINFVKAIGAFVGFRNAFDAKLNISIGTGTCKCNWKIECTRSKVTCRILGVEHKTIKSAVVAVIVEVVWA